MNNLKEKLGFVWDVNFPNQLPVKSLAQVIFYFKKAMPQHIWDAAQLEGNPFTFPQVQTVLEGVSVGGHKISDQQQVLNLAEASRYFVSLVSDGKFELSKEIFTHINALVAKDESLEWGVFRGEGKEKTYDAVVNLGENRVFRPIKTEDKAPALNHAFYYGIDAIKQIESIEERAAAMFLFGALQQFFFDGNKRTARFMMNGVLMTNGIEPISVPASRAEEFNEKMVRFYQSRNANEMMLFLMSCHPSHQIECAAQSGFEPS